MGIGLALEAVWAAISGGVARAVANPYVVGGLVAIGLLGGSFWLGTEYEANKRDALEAKSANAGLVGRIGGDELTFGKIDLRLGEMVTGAADRERRETSALAQLDQAQQEMTDHAQGDDYCGVRARDIELLNSLDAAPATVGGGGEAHGVPDH